MQAWNALYGYTSRLVSVGSVLLLVLLLFTWAIFNHSKDESKKRIVNTYHYLYRCQEYESEPYMGMIKDLRFAYSIMFSTNGNTDTAHD